MNTSFLLYRSIRFLVRVAAQALGGYTVIGLENIPKQGAAILAPNHRAHVDPPYVSFLTSRQIFFMAKQELFDTPVVGPAIRKSGAFPVRRGTADREALRTAVNHLKAGHLVAIFPEGTRAEGAQMLPAEKGFALIARQTGAPIIPIAIEGTDDVLPRGAKWPQRARVRVTIGAPITAAQLLAEQAETDQDALTRIGEATMTRIAGLMQERPAPEAAVGV